MIVHVTSPAALAQSYRGFLDALATAGFRGEISASHADRTVLATDNSIYSGCRRRSFSRAMRRMCGAWPASLASEPIAASC
jgi:hypothetical protein